MKKTSQTIYYSKTNARKNLPSIINRVRDGEGPIYITDRGTTTAIVISSQEFEKLSKKPKKRFKFSDLGWIGMWKNREDMTDSVAWVNKIREEEESKSYK